MLLPSFMTFQRSWEDWNLKMISFELVGLSYRYISSLCCPVEFDSYLLLGLDDQPCEGGTEIVVQVVFNNECCWKELCYPWSNFLKPLKHISVGVFLSFHKLEKLEITRISYELIVLWLDSPSVMSCGIWHLFVFSLIDQSCEGVMGIVV